MEVDCNVRSLSTEGLLFVFGGAFSCLTTPRKDSQKPNRPVGFLPEPPAPPCEKAPAEQNADTLTDQMTYVLASCGNAQPTLFEEDSMQKFSLSEMSPPGILMENYDAVVVCLLMCRDLMAQPREMCMKVNNLMNHSESPDGSLTS